jgi:hypothetical protein
MRTVAVVESCAGEAAGSEATLSIFWAAHFKYIDSLLFAAGKPLSTGTKRSLKNKGKWKRSGVPW